MIAKRTCRVHALLTGLAMLVGASGLLAQGAPVAPPAATPAANASAKQLAKQWEDLLHYIKVAQEDMALSLAKSILAAGADPQEIYILSTETAGAQAVLARGAKLKDMQKPIDEICALVEKGYEAMRSDPEQIAEAIKKLSGQVRAARNGAQRLLISGQYAMPQLMEALAGEETGATARERIMALLPKMGRRGVRPLAVALQAKDSRIVEAAATALGRIGYPHASARLREALDRTDLLDRTKRIIKSALLTCGGEAAPDAPTSSLFLAVAQKYYYRKDSILPDERYDTTRVWYWRNKRLEYRAVPQAIFCDVYAMRCARLALKHNPKMYQAVSLWLAAFFKREIDLPAGAADPIAPPERARYYALASSASYLQDVLRRAMKDRDTAVAVRVIRELARTAGAQSLAQPLVRGQATPLVEALRYPNRRVRLLAALSLARALPRKSFLEADRVVAVMNSALALGGKRTVAVVVADAELRNRLMDVLRGADCRIIEKTTAAEAIQAVHAAGGADAFVLAGRPEPLLVLRKIREDTRLALTPAIVVADSPRVTAALTADALVLLHSPKAMTPKDVKASLDKVFTLGGNEPMSGAEAARWIIDAAKAIRMLGLTGGGVFDVRLTGKPLAAATKHSNDAVRIAAAQALATLEQPEAQQAVAELAGDAEAPEAVRVAAYDALSESARRFRNYLTDEQAQAVLAVVTGGGSRQLREAAAEALGALNLSSEKIKALILSTAGSD